MCPFSPSKIPFAAPSEWTIGSDGSLTIDGDLSASFKYDTTNAGLAVRDRAGNAVIEYGAGVVVIGATTDLPSDLEVRDTRVGFALATGAPFKVVDVSSGDPFMTIERNAGAGAIGFYGHAAVAQQTGVAVNAGAIHAALVALGLITA